MENLMEKVVSLCKRRGFIFPGSEIYGGLQNSWDYGPLGVELKNNIKMLWWKRFVHARDDVVGLDAAIIMNPKVWETSGHLKEFSDPLVECKKCHARYREDQMAKHRGGYVCDSCGGKEFTKPKQFNLMLKTFLGPTEDAASAVYLRPETAQAMFVDFKSVLETSRKRLPFGIAQIGKAFRNEITPGNFIFRTREFEIMEIEYFIRPPAASRIDAEENGWEFWFEHWRGEMRAWMEQDLGINMEHIHELDVPEGDRAHYSKKTIDFEYDYPFGRKELYGLAYRTDFDLKAHEKFSGQSLKYRDPETGEEFTPHVVEPTWGVDRSVLVTLLEAYREEPSSAKAPEGKGEKRIVLKLPPKLAPYKAAVFPLLQNKPELVNLARKKVYDDLRQKFCVAWDDRGNIGKRYFSQDEIGTPYCITIDFDSLEKHDVTVRDRDTMQQIRVPIEMLRSHLEHKIYE